MRKYRSNQVTENSTGQYATPSGRYVATRQPCYQSPRTELRAAFLLLANHSSKTIDREGCMPPTILVGINPTGKSHWLCQRDEEHVPFKNSPKSTHAIIAASHAFLQILILSRLSARYARHGTKEKRCHRLPPGSFRAKKKKSLHGCACFCATMDSQARIMANRRCTNNGKGKAFWSRFFFRWQIPVILTQRAVKSSAGILLRVRVICHWSTTLPTGIWCMLRRVLFFTRLAGFSLRVYIADTHWRSSFWSHRAGSCTEWESTLPWIPIGFRRRVPPPLNGSHRESLATEQYHRRLLRVFERRHRIITTTMFVIYCGAIHFYYVQRVQWAVYACACITAHMITYNIVVSCSVLSDGIKR